jgi:hypothetical protein
MSLIDSIAVNQASTAKDRVEKATVRLHKRRGRWGACGVFVPGGHILTAAHCITWKGTGMMALGEPFLEPVETSDGRILVTQVCAVEPVADIAVLGPPDDQMFSEQFLDFEESIEQLPCVPISLRTYPFGKSFEVEVFTHKRQWLKAKATAYRCKSNLCLEASDQIEGGTSGSPVIDKKGRLVGLVSSCMEGKPYSGNMPAPFQALPRCFGDAIRHAQKDLT